MTRTLSQDLRSRVIAVVDSGISCSAAAARFGIAVSSAVRWMHVWRAEGRVTALRDVILAAIEVDVDITLSELAELLSSWHRGAFAPGHGLELPRPSRPHF